MRLEFNCTYNRVNHSDTLRMRNGEKRAQANGVASKVDVFVLLMRDRIVVAAFASSLVQWLTTCTRGVDTHTLFLAAHPHT